MLKVIVAVYPQKTKPQGHEMRHTSPTCVISIEIDVFDYEIRLLANIGNQLCDLFDISSLADQKRAAKIVDKLEMINMSGHYGQMNIKVASKVLDKFLHDNVLVRLDEKIEKLKVRDSKNIQKDVSNEL